MKSERSPTTGLPDQTEPKAIETVCAVVVTFEPEITRLANALDAICLQVDQLVVVDNASSRPVRSEIIKISKLYQAELILLDENSGIAGGQNRGIEFALSHGFEYVLLLDHDSVAGPAMVRKLVAAHTERSKHDLVSAVGPQFVPDNKKFRPYFVRFGPIRIKKIYCDGGEQIIPADFLIASGTLTSREAFEVVGLMDEKLFIDHVDTEWFMRARSQGRTAYGVCDATMSHSLGDSFVSAVGSNRSIPLHSPLRHYYVFRNSVDLFKRSYLPWQWRVNDTYRLTAMFLFFLLYAPHRLQRIRLIFTGVWHGMIGRLGKYSGG